MKGKRKRVVVSLEKKLEALKRLDQGQKIKRVASELGVGEATVSDWRKKREEIEKWCFQISLGMCNETIHRKTMKKGEFENISEALYMWFIEMRKNDSPVSGPILQSKALELHRSFNEGTEFTASNGWLERWKRKYGISGKKLNKTVMQSSTSATETNPCTVKTETIIEEESLSLDENDSCVEVINYNIFPMEMPVKNEGNSPLDCVQSHKESTIISSDVSGEFKLNYS